MTWEKKPVQDNSNCRHINGWWRDIKFFIFTKRLYVCTDCACTLTKKQYKNLKFPAPVFEGLNRGNHD